MLGIAHDVGLDALSKIGIDNLDVLKIVLELHAAALQEQRQELLLVTIQCVFIIATFIDGELRVMLVNVRWKQSSEDRVPSIRRGSWKNRTVIIALNREERT